MTLADSKWWYRIVADSYDGPRVLRERYAHPWEAELEMLKHCLSGWVQGFAPGSSRTYVRDWLRVDP